MDLKGATDIRKQTPFASRDDNNFIVPSAPLPQDIFYPHDPDLPDLEDEEKFSDGSTSRHPVPDRSLKPSKLEIPTR